MLCFSQVQKYLSIVWTKPYCRASSYLVGCWLGYRLHIENGLASRLRKVIESRFVMATLIISRQFVRETLCHQSADNIRLFRWLACFIGFFVVILAACISHRVKLSINSVSTFADDSWWFTSSCLLTTEVIVSLSHTNAVTSFIVRSYYYYYYYLSALVVELLWVTELVFSLYFSPLWHVT